MNWYRFKIELSAVIVKTAFAVLTTLVALQVLFEPPRAARHYPVSMRSLAENEWIIEGGLSLAVVVLWLCYWKIFRIYRGNSEYGTK